MVAVIKTGQSVRRIFHYNENKVSLGDALCIGERNYPADHNHLSSSLKINLLLNQLELNENVKRGSVHISLNFHPMEKDLNPEKLMDIANTYMAEIGFSDQPFLVYQHFDAAHPHIHIISVKVKPDGRRIDMQNIGRNQSENARIKIEKDFNLIKAQGREKQVDYSLGPMNPSIVSYGKIQSKKAVAKVLDFVLNTYQYKSLPQLNAVLNLYNVMADRGSESSRVFKGGGLVYRIVDKDGKQIGVPIKASDFYNKPTLRFLEGKFEENRIKNSRPGLRIKNEVRSIFQSETPSLQELALALESHGITLVQRLAQNGSLYGLTYIDHVSKQVCNGSELGKEFSAASVLQGCRNTKGDFLNTAFTSEFLKNPAVKILLEIQDILVSKKLSPQPLQEFISSLFEKEYPGSYLPTALRKKKKRRKRKGLSNN